MHDRDNIVRLLQAGSCMVKSVDVVPRGHIRIETGFMYPDGSNIDVFVVDDLSAPLLPATNISDLGQTMAFLLNHDVKPWSSAKRRSQLENAVSLYGVEVRGGALVKRIADTNLSLRESVISLGQACVRMSDLLFTKRLQLQSAFTDEVEEFLSDTDLPYEPSASLPGQFGQVSIDFLVRGATTTSAVMTLFSRVPAASHGAANEVFRKMHDLQAAGRPEQRVTLLDDTIDIGRVYRDDDLRRLSQYSTVLPFSDRASTRTLLAA